MRFKGSESNRAKVKENGLHMNGTILIKPEDTAVPVCGAGHYKKAEYAEADIWHMRLEHQNYRQLKTTKKNVEGVEMVSDEFTDCETCYEGKSTKVNTPKMSPTKATRPGEKLHIDPTGRMPVETVSGKTSALLITDDYSKVQMDLFNLETI